jgi:hypothetical protein
LQEKEMLLTGQLPACLVQHGYEGSVIEVWGERRELHDAELGGDADMFSGASRG